MKRDHVFFKMRWKTGEEARWDHARVTLGFKYMADFVREAVEEKIGASIGIKREPKPTPPPTPDVGRPETGSNPHGSKAFMKARHEELKAQGATWCPVCAERI
jgi:hypothetical protein